MLSGNYSKIYYVNGSNWSLHIVVTVLSTNLRGRIQLTYSEMKSNPAALVITVVIAALALGAGLIIGYLLRKPEGQEARSGIHGELTPVKLLRSTTENETLKECSDLMDNPDIKK